MKLLKSVFRIFYQTYCSNSLKSVLYVSGDKSAETYALVTPYLNFSKLFTNVEEFEDCLKQRGYNTDVKYLMEKWDEFLIAKQKVEVLLIEKNSIINDIKQSAKNSTVIECLDQKDSLMFEIRDAKNQLWELEKTCVTSLVHLPNCLHPLTPFKDHVSFVYKCIPEFDFTPLHHIELGKLGNMLEMSDVSQGAYYLKNVLAILELGLCEFASETLTACSFKLQVNPDFAKSVIVEGCGLPFTDPFSVLTLKQGELVDQNLLHLVGGSSFSAFAAIFTRQIIQSNVLPLKIFGFGRDYQNTSCLDRGLFNSVQSTLVGGLVVLENEKCGEQVMNEILSLLFEFYIKLEVHFKIVHYCASSLHNHESIAYGVLMYSPGFNDYFEVARVSLSGTYISQRLWMTRRVKPGIVSFVSLVHLNFMNVTRLIGLLLENSQLKDKTFGVPLCLKPYLYGTNCKYI